MSKRKTGWTEAKISLHIKEGRGQSELALYKSPIFSLNIMIIQMMHLLETIEENRPMYDENH
jgi:hypothetical protein